MLWQPTETIAYLGRTAEMNAGLLLYRDPWWPTLQHVRTSACRSIRSFRNRSSAATPASPVKTIRKRLYCKINAFVVDGVVAFDEWQRRTDLRLLCSGKALAWRIPSSVWATAGM